MGTAIKIYGWLLFALFLFGCQAPSTQNENISNSNKTKPSVNNLTESFLCRQVDIDSIVNDRAISDCLDLSMYDEKCYEDIQQQQFVRLTIAPLKDGYIKILTIEMNSTNCWLRTVKKIPRNSFGSFAYLVQGKDIEFSVAKSLTNKVEYDRVKTLASLFKEKDTLEQAEYIFILEYINQNVRQKLYLNSNQVSAEQEATILGLIN